MSLLIKGADISPDRIQCITVFPEGFAVVEEYEMLLPIKTTKCEVAYVPTPHGRLIDADLIYQETMRYSERTRKMVMDMVNAMPTIIEAEV